MRLIPTIAFLVAAGLASGSIITDYPVLVSYDSGVAATAGTGGASDPTGQGWSANGTATAFSHGQAANGGWRITDGTTATPYFYQHAISSGDATSMTTKGWVASWTTAVNADAMRDTGSGNVDNYYSSVPSRQNDNAFWLELAGVGLWIMTFENDANGDIFLNDGTNSFQITNTGGNLSEEVGTGSPSATYITYDLIYSTSTGTATLSDSLGGMHGVVSTSGGGGTNRLVWGATSSGGQGSTTWNALSIAAVPEASEVSLFALGALALAFCRRK